MNESRAITYSVELNADDMRACIYMEESGQVNGRARQVSSIGWNSKRKYSMYWTV